jgi:hypothetical protein
MSPNNIKDKLRLNWGYKFINIDYIKKSIGLYKVFYIFGKINTEADFTNYLDV